MRKKSDEWHQFAQDYDRWNYAYRIGPEIRFLSGLGLMISLIGLSALTESRWGALALVAAIGFASAIPLSEIWEQDRWKHVKPHLKE